MKIKHMILLIALLMPIAAWGKCRTVAGTWALTTRIYKGSCDTQNRTEKMTVKLKQKGCSLTFDFGYGVTLSGTLKGNTAHISGSYDDGGEIKKSLKIIFQGNRLRGGGKWSYDMYGMYSCKGTEKITGQKK